MGVNPTYVAWCRRCGSDVFFPCHTSDPDVGEAETFYEDSDREVPASIAKVLNGKEEKCGDCGTPLKIHADVRVWIKVRKAE